MAETPDPVAGTPARAGRRMASHSVIYVVGAALQGLGVLLILPFATRLLGAAEFGRVATGLVVVQMVGTLAAAGLPQVIIREHHRGREGPRVARALAGVMIGFAVAVGALGVVVLVVLASTTPVDLGVAIPVLGAAVALTVVVSGQSLMRARMQPGRFLVLAVAGTVLAQLAGLLAVWQQATAARYLGAYAVVLGVVAVGAIILGRPLPPTVERERTRAGVRLAAPLVPQAVAMLGLLMGDVLLTRWLLGEAATGGYQVALQLGNMPFVLSTALFNAWGPLVLSHPLDRRAAFTARTGSALTVIVGFGALGVALLGPWLVAVMAPASFGHVELVTALGSLAPVAVLYMVYQGSSLAVLDAERTGQLAWAALAALLALVVVAIPLSSLGIVGIALAKLAGYGVLAALTTWFAVRHSRLRWPGWVGGFTIGIIVGSALVGGLLPLVGTGAWVRLLLAALVAVLSAAIAPRVLRSLRG